MLSEEAAAQRIGSDSGEQASGFQEQETAGRKYPVYMDVNHHICVKLPEVLSWNWFRIQRNGFSQQKTWISLQNFRNRNAGKGNRRLRNLNRT